MKLSQSDLAAVLAGLRYLQTAIDSGPENLPFGLSDVFTDGGTATPLTAPEIDALCERINGEPDTPGDLAIALVQEAIDAWPHFDDPDAPVNGGDMVEWFAGWRKRAKTGLANPTAPRVAIIVQGGLVQEIVTDAPLNLEDLVVIDYDTECVGDEDIAQIKQSDGTFSGAAVSRPGISRAKIDLAALSAEPESTAD